MRLMTTRNGQADISFQKACLEGLGEDGGLYLPRKLPLMTNNFFKHLPDLSFKQVAFEVSKQVFQGEILENDLQEIVDQSMTFQVPLVEVEPNIFSLELFHGPTLSFKDFGARFMAQLFRYFHQKNDQTLHILVATSGDTGSAVANGFLGVDGMKVWVLYPRGKVSEIQEKQIATLGENVTALAVEGTFDDCQQMVKSAFQDKKLREKIKITSANSINIARLIPQSFYYFYAYGQCHLRPLVFSVPCGNFGNLTGGILAKKMGLKVDRFVAATNINNVVPNYLETGHYKPRPSIKTLSNAMDVGSPSNFERLQTLYRGNLEEMRQDLWGVSYTDSETVNAIENVYHHTGYIMDPHGAVSYLGLKAYGKRGIFLETAHPAKFKTAVEAPIPVSLQACLLRPNLSVPIPASYKELCSLLLQEA